MLGVRVLEEKNMAHTISTERLVHVLQSIALKQQTGIPALPIDMEETRQTPAIGVPVLLNSTRSPGVPVISSVPEVEQCVKNMLQQAGRMIFQALPRATRQDVILSMERRKRVVLLLLDGKRSLRHVAYLLHRSDLEIAYTLASLLEQGYIEYVGS